MLVDFWTYSCINCLRTLPAPQDLGRAPTARPGLTIVGVHTPEFAFEHVPSNVRKATRELGVRYPVAIDDGYKTWDAYQNGAWPTEYLIDRRGHIREIKEGEGNYDETERTIRKLLGEPATGAARIGQGPTTPAHPTTPESYLGWERLAALLGSELVPDRIVPVQVPAHVAAEHARLRRPLARRAAAHRRRSSARACACTSWPRTSTSCSSGRGTLQVLVDGKPVQHDPRRRAEQALHAAAATRSCARASSSCASRPGVSAYAFTFG